MFKTIVILLGFAMILGCSEQSNQLEDTPSNSYLYTSYDSTGTVIVKGWLSIDYIDSVNINGHWSFNEIGNHQNIGPQYGKGELNGSITNDFLSINLHPKFRDNNIILIGKVTDNSFIGKWEWISFRGITNYGTFIATKE